MKGWDDNKLIVQIKLSINCFKKVSKEGVFTVSLISFL